MKQRPITKIYSNICQNLRTIFPAVKHQAVVSNITVLSTYATYGRHFYSLLYIK